MLTYAAIQTIADTVAPPGTFATPDVEPDFAKLVRSASVLLKANNPITYEDIRRATPGVYMEISLRIAAARYADQTIVLTNADGSQSVTNTSDSKAYQWSEDDILAMLTPDGAAAGLASAGNERLGSYSGAIEWAASKMVAAHVIRTIPLNNTSLKFVDVADNMQTLALADIDRIIQISQSSNAGSTSASDDADSKGQATLCIAHSVDLTTLPEAAFDVPDPGSSPATYDGPVSPTGVEVVNTISVGTDEVGICYFYMTGQAANADQDLIVDRVYGISDGQPKTSESVSYKIEKAFKLIDDTTLNPVSIDDIITILADEINSETLTVTNGNVANILVGPQRGQTRNTAQSVIKRDLYPNTTTLPTRRANFELYHRINKLSFDVRRYSAKVDTEMFTVGFYTVPEADWLVYEGIATPTEAQTRALRASGTLGIDGLIFGEQDLYNGLGDKTPYSALLNVEKGNAAAVSIAPDSGGSTDLADSFGDSSAINVIDTLYFAYDDPAVLTQFTTPFAQDLVLRVSTTSYIASTPLTITVDLTTQFTNPYWSDTGNPLYTDITIGEQIAGRVVDAIYDFTRNTNINAETQDNSNVLGVLLGDYQRFETVVNRTAGTAKEVAAESYIEGTLQTDLTTVQPTSYLRDEIAGRVQIVAFRYRDEEYRMVVEILQIPPNLYIATGNFILRRTEWALGRRRSITAETKVLTSSASVADQTIAEELNSVNASVGKAEASKSPALQSVFDKRKLLKEAQKGFPIKWNRDLSHRNPV